MNKLFGLVFRLHYVAVLAVIAPFFGAALMLLLGTKDTIEAYLLFFGVEEPDGAVEAGEAAMIKLVASIDHFLFAAILMIFAIGLYALFFRSSSHTEDKDSHQKALSWNHIKNMGGMDEMLLKVIIMLLAVTFLEFLLASGIDTLSWTVLVVPLTIIALAIGLKWMSAASEEEQKEKKAPEKLSSPNDTLDALERLAKLHDQGAISDTEFEDAKTKVLAG
jgi:uncharacterized membrane protein YqhA